MSQRPSQGLFTRVLMSALRATTPNPEVKWDGSHRHLRAEAIDHGQQAPRRHIGVCHGKLP